MERVPPRWGGRVFPLPLGLFLLLCVLASGRFPEAKRMAGDIVASQSAEIATMRSPLKR